MITREQFEEELWRFLATYDLQGCADMVVDSLDTVDALDDFPDEEPGNERGCPSRCLLTVRTDPRTGWATVVCAGEQLCPRLTRIRCENVAG